MATIANTNFPSGEMPVHRVSTPISNRFPVPSQAFGFMILVDFEPEEQGLEPPYYINSALNPESIYLEPTIGQIWPR